MAPNFTKMIGTTQMSCEECWVTMAEDDTSAVRALVLAKCLRRVVTTRKIAVVICAGVTEHYRKLLQANFDQCLKLDMSYEQNGIPLRLYVKMFCWSLPFMRKCVFLDHGTMILKNCDELFDFPGTSAVLDAFDLLDTSVVVFEPSFDDYMDLCTWLGKRHTTNGKSVDVEFRQWIMNRKQFCKLPSRYNLELDLETGNSAWNDSDLHIIRFTGTHPIDFVEIEKTEKEMNILEKGILKYWKDTYAQDVMAKSPSQIRPLFQKTNRLALPGINQAILDANKEPIAIIGMSCRFPLADNVEEYWDILVNGKDCIRKVPDHRWPGVSSEDYREVQAGFLKCPVDEFDGKFFNISPMELTHTDPQQRFLLEVSWEALEHAGINPQTLAGTNAGVFVGTWTQDYRDLIKNINGEFSDFHRTYMGNSLGGTSGRLSFLLGLTGPNIASESGCSSGMVAVYLACESLRKRRSDIALAAGANLLLHPYKTKHMVNVASPDGRCKTFDEKADGFGRAEGVATLVLKRYSDAVKAGDNVLALIRGCGVAQEGTSRSFGTPTKEVQEIAMQAALDDAGVSPLDVDYIEAHGTGTVIGDTTEMAAIRNLYCKQNRDSSLLIASGKTNIGHTESCSGIAGIIKVVLSMRQNLIPPHINLNNLNPHIKLDNVPIRIPTAVETWENPNGKPRIAGISSFGITGTNAHVILQESPHYKKPSIDIALKDRPLHLVTFSAKSESSLDAVLESYIKYFESNPKVNFADVAFSCNTGKAHFPYRVAIAAESNSDACQKIRCPQKYHVSETSPGICFLFTGQGSQYEGMAHTLYNRSPVFRMNFDRCNSILEKEHGISITEALWTPGKNSLHKSLYSQTSIFCVEYCLTKLWESWGIHPNAVIGHSLGEFAAAVCAGLLAFEDALKLVATRSQLIEKKAPPGQMIVIRADKSRVDSLVKQFSSKHPNLWLDYAAINSQEQIVLAGSEEAVKAFSTMCQTETISLKTYVLDATNAFHSRDMDHILSEYKKVVATVNHSSSKCTYISGVTGKILEKDDMNTEYWIRHTRDPVKFLKASQIAFNEGYRVFLEIGPQPVLCALAMGNNNCEEISTFVPSLRKKESEWFTLLTSLSKLYQLGFDIDWIAFDQFYDRKRIHLPSYPFNGKKHWYETNESKHGIMFNAKSIHPLLGCQIPNATSTSIFHASVILEQIPFLKDHAIGGQIVFPAAGFLEMCLTAGCLSTTGQLEVVNPMSVENLTVESPLGITDKDCCSLQTIVSKEDGEDNKICIFSQKDAKGLGKWTRQAVAKFVPLQVNYRLQEEMPKLHQVQDRCDVSLNAAEFYETLANVGLEFGPAFKSLKNVWKNPNGNEILTEIQVSDETEHTCTNYMIHPILLDSLIQTLMMSECNSNGSLFVPLVIGRTIIYAKSEYKQRFYAQCSWENNQGAELRSATLYDSTGKVLAVVAGVQMIETSVEAIVKNLTTQALSIPNVYEEVWRPKIGPMKTRTDLKTLTENIYSQSFADELAHTFHLNEEHKKMVGNRRKLVYLYILKAFYELGWEPKLNQEISINHFISKLNILPSFDKLINRYLTILFEEGILSTGNEGGNWKLSHIPPPLSEILERIEECVQFIRHHPNETADAKVTIGCGERLAQFLSGNESALSFLFPEDKTTEVCAEAFYNESITVNAGHTAFKAIVEKLMENYCTVPEEQRGVIRFLEVGSGTGSTTKRVLPMFDRFQAKFNYTYTDISPAFFLKAQPMLESYGKKIHYKVLNIEEDPLAQGFIPHHYDIIIASNVLHATKNLSESVRNVRTLLKENGILLMIETLQPIREYDIVFGLLDGFWRFDDYNIRPDYPNASIETWKNVCKNEGYEDFREFPCFGGQVGVLAVGASSNNVGNAAYNNNASGWWIVFADKNVYPNYLHTKFNNVQRQVIVVSKSNAYSYNENEHHFFVRASEKEDILNVFRMVGELKLKVEGIAYMWGLEGEIDQVKITTGFLFLAQILLSEFKGLPRFVLVTEGIMPIVDETAVDVGPSTLWGMVRSFRTEHFNMHVRSIDLDPDEQDLQLKYDELFTEFWNDDNEYQISYRQRSRHVCRLVHCKDFATPLSLPNSDRFSVVLPATKNIADLRFCPNGKPTLSDTQLDIEIHATGLNFRDVFVVLKPEEQFDSINCLGLEFAGVVVGVGQHAKNFKVGDHVMGCKFSDGALPSHIQMDEELLFRMPEHLTFCEAATIPAAFATAYYCLVMIAQLQKGETVLIHAGSGGVGLFAIQVAKAVGANIIATAGSIRKRAFLKNLGIQHVFHSRNTHFGQQIQKLTNGKGVQVVLNSLTSPGFKEASMRVLCQNGRFIEMSKLHIWSNEEVKALRPDVNYSIVDLTTTSKETWQTFWAAILDYMKQGKLHPIPYVRYEASCIREALTYMQKAKHIGKVVVAMPQMMLKDSRFEPDTNNIFNERSTYLITGGLGGIGMQVAKWMCKNGAKHLVLTSRRAPDETAERIMKELRSQGKNIVALSVDVGDYEQCANLFRSIEDPKLNLPKLRGIMHAAGTLADATYVNQTVDTFKAVFQGKVYGAWNLHQLSTDYPLEHFMMFSSMVSILGPIGLGNYAAANAYLDALCHHRYALGLCGQVINWGQWAEVGAAKHVNMPAVKPFSPTQGLLALEIIMRSQKTQIAVLDVDFAYVRKLTSNTGTYLEELKITKGNQGVAFTVKIGNFWDEFNGCDTSTKKIDCIKSYVETILRQILKFDDDETIDDNQNFSEMGMDSLMMLEMKNFLQTMLGKNISMNVSEMAELTTINKLASHVLQLIKKSENCGEPLGTTNAGEKEYNYFSPQTRKLIEEDMILPKHITCSGNPCKPSNVRVVLLTGVTGKLGPYFLEALAKRPLEKIYCLIRAENDTAARTRLAKALEEKELSSLMNSSKVECIAGNITDTMLGLSADHYENLGQEIEAIVHCAVKGNLMEPYIKPDDLSCSNNLIRTVNVIGTRNMLEFASRGTTKRILHASTLLACHKVTDDDLLFEDWCEPQDVFKMTNIGYPVSKFICEILAGEGNKRGIPVQAHRFPGLLGDKNGCFSFPNNHAMLRLLGFCKLGAMPSIPVPLQVLDVDFAAEISCQIFFNDEASSGVYNISNPNMTILQEFPSLAQEFGFHVDIVEYEDFFRKLSDNEQLQSVFPYREVDLEGGRFVDFTLSPVVMQCWSRNPDQFFVSSKVTSLIADYVEKTKSPIDILRRDMLYARNKGIFTKMKLM